MRAPISVSILTITLAFSGAGAADHREARLISVDIFSTDSGMDLVVTEDTTVKVEPVAGTLTENSLLFSVFVDSRLLCRTDEVTRTDIGAVIAIESTDEGCPASLVSRIDPMTPASVEVDPPGEDPPGIHVRSEGDFMGEIWGQSISGSSTHERGIELHLDEP